MVDPCHYTFVQPIEYTAPRVNPNVNYGLWVITMCQCRFINCNKCPAMEGDVDSGGDCACVGVLELYGKSLNFSLTSSMTHKAALKTKVYFLKKEKKEAHRTVLCVALRTQKAFGDSQGHRSNGQNLLTRIPSMHPFQRPPGPGTPRPLSPHLGVHASRF